MAVAALTSARLRSSGALFLTFVVTDDKGETHKVSTTLSAKRVAMGGTREFDFGPITGGWDTKAYGTWRCWGSSVKRGYAKGTSARVDIDAVSRILRGDAGPEMDILTDAGYMDEDGYVAVKFLADGVAGMLVKMGLAEGDPTTAIRAY